MNTIRSSSNHAFGLFAGCVLMALAAPAFATSTWSNLGSGGATACNSSPSIGNVLNCTTQNSVGLTADAFSTSDGVTSTTGTTFAKAALYNWGSAGLGVVNQFENPNDTGPHATDNRYGTDAIRLTFTSALSLTNIGIGWSGSSNGNIVGAPTTAVQDSDFSVLAWTGPGTPGAVETKTLDGSASTSTLLTQGWTWVGNYANLTTNQSASISTSIYSSYWLVSAYNTAFGSVSQLGSGAASGLDAGNDYFKLLSVAGNTQPSGGKAPEPGSLALMGAALASILVVRHRKGPAA